MHLLEIVRLRRNIAWLLLGACAACISVSAQAKPKTSGKTVSEPAATASDTARLQTSYTFTGMLDSEDCFDDYGRLAQAASVAGAESAMYGNAAAKRPLPDNAPDARRQALPAGDAVAPAPAAAPAAPAPLAPIAAPPAPAWEIVMTDKTINGAFARWTTLAGWQLRWELPVDYAVEARTTVPGTFEEAVETVARSMETAEVPMKAIFYRGNKVLRIVPRGGK